MLSFFGQLLFPSKRALRGSCEAKLFQYVWHLPGVNRRSIFALRKRHLRNSELLLHERYALKHLLRVLVFRRVDPRYKQTWSASPGAASKQSRREEGSVHPKNPRP